LLIEFALKPSSAPRIKDGETQLLMLKGKIQINNINMYANNPMSIDDCLSTISLPNVVSRSLTIAAGYMTASLLAVVTRGAVRLLNVISLLLLLLSVKHTFSLV
jgi:hypothetical protein